MQSFNGQEGVSYLLLLLFFEILNVDIILGGLLRIEDTEGNSVRLCDFADVAQLARAADL